ncbi:hypothetical protein TcasGA2_TC001972 [Tribolium castaneum]|uniref:Uncharacterized protein n=1 Tax=Tribolium castaneum TaxID=7070 RepID=D7EK54_TRICA|nr:hypothetical protein TcasGA2_TC001972 [Tribolium castaneum]
MSSPPLSVPVTGIKTNDYTKTRRYCILDKDLMAAHLADEEIDYQQARSGPNEPIYLINSLKNCSGPESLFSQYWVNFTGMRPWLPFGNVAAIKISDSNCNIAISGNYFHLTRIEHRRKKNDAPTKSLH